MLSSRITLIDTALQAKRSLLRPSRSRCVHFIATWDPVHVDLNNFDAVVLFIYDAFVVFDREVAYFWTAKRIGGALLLFLANKWISMAVYVIQLVQFASFSSDKVSNLFPSHGKSDRNQRFVTVRVKPRQCTDD